MVNLNMIFSKETLTIIATLIIGLVVYLVSDKLKSKPSKYQTAIIIVGMVLLVIVVICLEMLRKIPDSIPGNQPPIINYNYFDKPIVSPKIEDSAPVQPQISAPQPPPESPQNNLFPRKSTIDAQAPPSKKLDVASLQPPPKPIPKQLHKIAITVDPPNNKLASRARYLIEETLEQHGNIKWDQIDVTITDLSVSGGSTKTSKVYVIIDITNNGQDYKYRGEGTGVSFPKEKPTPSDEDMKLRAVKDFVNKHFNKKDG